MSETKKSTSIPSGLFDTSIAIQNVLKEFGAKLQIHIPVVVTKEYDPDTDLVEVKPIIKKAFTDGKEISYEEWTPFNVHVAHFGTRAMTLVFPVHMGMTGWVISSDRDTYKAREENSNLELTENEGPSELASFDMGRYTQGFFIPDRWFPKESKYGIGYDMSTKNDPERNHTQDIGIRMIDYDKPRGGVFLKEYGAVHFEKEDSCLKIDFSDKEAGISFDMSGKHHRTFFGANNSRDIKLQTSVDKMNITLGAKYLKNDSSEDEDESTEKGEPTDDEPMYVSLDCKREIIKIDKGAKSIYLDLSMLQPAESVHLDKIWIPDSIHHSSITFSKRLALVGNHIHEIKEARFKPLDD